MARAANKLWTLEEFLAFDDGTDISYQLFEGRIVAMNPPLRGHAALAGRLARIVGNQLRPPCEVYLEAGIVPINRRHSWYKADLIVTCTPGNFKDQFVAEPVLVVEDHHFDALYDAYLADERVRDFIAEANPAALGEIAERFQEAVARGLWRPRGNSVHDQLAALRPSSDA